MERIQKSVYVDLPLQAVYNQWTQFEEFPLFMEGVKHVEQLDDKRLHWDVEIAGKPKEWNARITEQIPDQRIAWESEAGENTAGVVSFQADGPNRTQVNLELFYDPRDLSNRPEIRLGLYRGALRMILSTSKNLSRTATARPGGGAAPSGSRALHIPTRLLAGDRPELERKGREYLCVITADVKCPTMIWAIRRTSRIKHSRKRQKHLVRSRKRPRKTPWIFWRKIWAEKVKILKLKRPANTSGGGGNPARFLPAA